MRIQDSVALVTGTNRGIGRAIVEALLAAGAARVYAAARDPAKVAGLAAASAGRVRPVALDVTDHDRVAAAARECGDVGLLVNNAGVNGNTGLIAAPDLADARREMECNYFGTLAMCRAFAPVLKANGGGCIVNMASITARVNLPFMGSLSASKAALLSLSQGVRAELAAQGTRVVVVMPGATDTDMTAVFPPPKMPPSQVARALVEAVEGDAEEVYPGDMAEGLARGLAADPKAVERDLARILPG